MIQMCDCYDWEEAMEELVAKEEEEARPEEITVKVKPKKVNRA